RILTYSAVGLLLIATLAALVANQPGCASTLQTSTPPQIAGGCFQSILLLRNSLIIDRFALFIKILVLLGAALVLLMSQSFLAREKLGRFEFPVLVVFSVTGMLIMASAANFISLYLGLELQSLALYVLAAFDRDNLRSTEAGLKYFVLGA